MGYDVSSESASGLEEVGQSLDFMLYNISHSFAKTENLRKFAFDGEQAKIEYAVQFASLPTDAITIV